MAESKLLPIQDNVKIVNEDGTATPYLLLWLQQLREEKTVTEIEVEGKADLDGGNAFTGDQTVTGNLDVSGDIEVPSITADVITVDADPYGAGWDGNNEVPTKDDLYDKIQTIGGGGGLSLDDFMTGTKWVVLPHIGNNTLTTIGAGVTSSGTSGANWANTNEFTKRRRVNLLCAAAINSVRTLNTVEAMPCGIGDGWRWRGRFGVVADVATSKMMFGFCSNTALGAGVEPSALTAAVLCIGKDTTDNNFQIIHNDAAGGACTKIDLGASFPARTNNADIYDVEFWSDLGDANISYKVTNIVSSAQATGTIAANCPAAGTGVTDQGLKIGNATTAVSYQVAFFGMMYEQAYANDNVP